MTYDAKKRDIVGTLAFFCLGVLIGGFASAIVVLREWLQYKRSGVVEYHDVWRYVIVSSIGAVLQLVLLLYFLFTVL